MELVDILKCSFHLDPIRLAFKIDRIMQHFFFLVQIFDKTEDSVRLVIHDPLRFTAPLVLENDRQIGIQVRRLVHPAFDLLRTETCFLKNRIIRQKIHFCSGLPCLSRDRQKPVLQFHNRNASFVSVMMDRSLPADPDVHPRRKRIDDRRADAVQTSARLIRRIIKFSSCMQGCIYDPRRRHAFLVHSDRNAPPVVLHSRRTVFFQCHTDLRTKPCQVFIHGIVHNFIDQMI